MTPNENALADAKRLLAERLSALPNTSDLVDAITQLSEWAHYYDSDRTDGPFEPLFLKMVQTRLRQQVELIEDWLNYAAFGTPKTGVSSDYHEVAELFRDNVEVIKPELR